MALLSSRHRRRYIVLSVLLSILVILYVTTGPSSTTESEFYRKTVSYMNERSGLSSAHAPAKANTDAHTPQVPLQNANQVEDTRSEQEKEAERVEGMKSRLAEAASAAKKSASEKGLEMQEAVKVANANIASEAEKAAEKVKSVVTSVVAKATEAAGTISEKVEEKEKSVAGRKKFPIHEDELNENSVIKPGEDGVAKIGANVDNSPATPSTSDATADEPGTPHGPEITPKEELKRLLSLGPMVIFSKSYCPYSKKAKKILLEQMIIEPAPTVVELDQHEMGGELQSVLGAMTGRRTVPNVMIAGKSLGGGDDVEALMRDGSLGDKIMSMAGRKIQRAEAAPQKGMQ